MSARLVGTPASSDTIGTPAENLRGEWWRTFISPALNSCAVLELFPGSFTSDGPYGDIDAARENFMSIRDVGGAVNDIIDDVVFMVRSAMSSDGLSIIGPAGDEFGTVARARTNIRILAESDIEAYYCSLREEVREDRVDAGLDPEPPEYDPTGSGSGPTYLALPTVEPPPPCDDEDNLESAQTPPDRCLTSTSVSEQISHWTTATTPYLDRVCC
jgi:hypothetical protein